jgi:hypothetical protein
MDVTVRPDLPPSGRLRSIRAEGFTAGGRHTLYAHVRRAAVCSELQGRRAWRLARWMPGSRRGKQTTLLEERG